MTWIEGIIYMMWRGIAIGIFISAPMGPVGIMCIQRTLDKGRRDGFFTGIGAAISDLFYCLLTGFGLSFIEEFLEKNQNIIQLIGSTVLIAFSVYLFKKNPARNLKRPVETRTSVKKNILGGFLFTFSNPLILFLIIGLFARFNFLLPEFRFYHYIIGFIFIFIGAVIWWWVVTFFVDKLRAHFNLRSMWLVNRIIGAIILLFAIVGIVTGILNMTQASAATRHWNSVRGYGDFEATCGETLVISNRGPSDMTKMVQMDNGNGDFSFSFRIRNINSHPSRSYSYFSSDSTKMSVKNPAWMLLVKGNNGIVIMKFTPGEERLGSDVGGTPHLEIEASLIPLSGHSPILLGRKSVTKDIDVYRGPNAFRLYSDGGHFILKGGNREYRTLLDINPELELPDSIGFGVAPGGEIVVSDISLVEPDVCADSQTLSPEEIEREIKRSADPLVGYWGMLDRSFDEDLLKPGGDYILAITADHEGYRITYLFGARKNTGKWTTGMLKGNLRKSFIPGLYDVEWIDAEGNILSHDVKCQLDDDILKISFPYHNSTLRLCRVTLPSS